MFSFTTHKCGHNVSVGVYKFTIYYITGFVIYQAVNDFLSKDTKIMCFVLCNYTNQNASRSGGVTLFILLKILDINNLVTEKIK